jgi:hypothetical protein
MKLGIIFLIILLMLAFILLFCLDHSIFQESFTTITPNLVDKINFYEKDLKGCGIGYYQPHNLYGLQIFIGFIKE